MPTSHANDVPLDLSIHRFQCLWGLCLFDLHIALTKMKAGGGLFRTTIWRYSLSWWGFMEAGTLRQLVLFSSVKKRKAMNDRVWPAHLLSTQSKPQAHGLALPIFWVAPPTSVILTYRIPHSHTQSFVPLVIPGPTNLKIATSHHRILQSNTEGLYVLYFCRLTNSYCGQLHLKCHIKNLDWVSREKIGKYNRE